MGHLKDINKLMEESRLRKAKEREKKKQDRIIAYRQLCKEADKLLKKAIEEEKKKKMEYLSTLVPKTPQRALKQPKTEFNIYHSNLIEREPNDRDLFLTREELQQWEKDNWQCINWSKFDQVVNDTKKMLGLI